MNPEDCDHRRIIFDTHDRIRCAFCPSVWSRLEPVPSHVTVHGEPRITEADYWLLFELVQHYRAQASKSPLEP